MSKSHCCPLKNQKSNLSKANSGRDYRIFEEFAYRVVAQARECRATEIFKLGGNVYAFDS